MEDNKINETITKLRIQIEYYLSDENLKATINDRILEIIAKNNNIKEKVKFQFNSRIQIDKINRNNYFLKEDEDYLEEKLKDIKKSLDETQTYIK